jgi:hypothetical protein
MIQPAILCKEEINRLYTACYMDPKYDYFTVNNVSYFDLFIKDRDEDYIQLVSIYCDVVIGYFEAEVNRYSNKILNLFIVNFSSFNHAFAADLIRFIRLLKNRGFRKIEFSMVVGNPVEAQYDRLVKSLGGRVVGVFEKSIKIRSGEICDLKYYEFFLNE